MSDSVPKLGKLVEGKPGRDAIHIAIVAVVAGEDLRPGTHVGLRSDGTAVSRYEQTGDKPVGIVDPFLLRPVNKGETFWLCLYQGSITSLRHVWTHPEVDSILSESPPPPSVAPASERWLRLFAKEHYDDDYNGMMRDAGTGGLCFDHTDYPQSLEAEFYAHFRAVTQTDTSGDFRCAC